MGVRQRERTKRGVGRGVGRGVRRGVATCGPVEDGSVEDASVEVGQHEARDEQGLHQHVAAEFLVVLRRVEIQVLREKQERRRVHAKRDKGW